jgi:hypothetical protein
MTFEQALAYASAEAAVTGFRHRVYKSAIVGWWNVVQTTQLLGTQQKMEPISNG